MLHQPGTPLHTAKRNANLKGHSAALSHSDGSATTCVRESTRKHKCSAVGLTLALSVHKRVEWPAARAVQRTEAKAAAGVVADASFGHGTGGCTTAKVRSVSQSWGVAMAVGCVAVGCVAVGCGYGCGDRLARAVAADVALAAVAYAGTEPGRCSSGQECRTRSRAVSGCSGTLRPLWCCRCDKGPAIHMFSVCAGRATEDLGFEAVGRRRVALFELAKLNTSVCQHSQEPHAGCTAGALTEALLSLVLGGTSHLTQRRADPA